MAPFNWERVMNVDLRSLQENENESEEMYQLLTKSKFDTGACGDVGKMEKLYLLSQMLLRIKATEASIASEEIERMAESHNEQVERLQSEIRQFRKHTGGGEQSFIREIHILEERNRELERAIGNSERQAMDERRNNDQLSGKVEQLERQNKELKREVERCKADISDYHRQIEQHRDSMLTQHTGDTELRSKINDKNRDMNRYLDEIRSLADANSELEEKFQSVQKDLEESAIEMNKMTDEYMKLKTVLQQTDMIVEEMRKERDLLRAQVQDLRDQVATKTDNDDQIMSAINEKVEEWKSVIAGKDEELARYQKVIEDLRKQTAVSQVDADKQTIVVLRDELREKNEQVESLEQQLKDVSNEMKVITDQIEDIKNQADKGLPSAFQQKQINELHKTLNREKMTGVVERNRVKLAEKAVADKDKEVNELVAKIMRYERGEYGLSQAVQEIKDLKANLRMRDEKIEGLISQVNQLGIGLNDAETENEELRERLGLDPKQPLDAEALREKKMIKTQQQAALNRELSREIERLEEERLQLKKRLRKQALHRGQRAVELGLTVEDLAVAERFEEDDDHLVLKTRSEPALSSTKAVELEANNERLKKEISKRDKDSDSILTEVKKIKSENKELKAENHQLEVGLREVLGQLRENPMMNAAGENMLLRVPALEKLIAMFECRSATGQYDVHVELRATIEQLVGRNEELRNELQKAREESTGLALLVDRKNSKISEMEEEIEGYREAGDGIIKIQPLILPEGLTPSSTEVISCLNEYLTQTIQECSLKESMLQKMEDELENFKRKFAVMVHQKGVLYQEYLSERTEWEKQVKCHEQETTELKRQRETDGVRILEFDRLLENLATDPDTLKTRVGELTRKITVLRVNERALARRYTAMQEVEGSMRRENEKLKRDMVDMEGAVQERLGYLERYKEIAGYKIAVLQRSLDESCPSSELESANREFNELTSKYRDLLQRENTLVERSSKLEALEAEVSQLRTERDQIMKELGNEKERCHTMEQTLSDLVGRDSTKTSSVRADEINSVARKLATLEIKELNERQRADHATNRYDQMRGMLKVIEDRNDELEQRVSELTKLNMEAQRIERELRGELDGAVSKKYHEAGMQRARNLEESEAMLKVELMRMKEMSEVAAHQAEAIQAQQEFRDKELMSLRKQLYDIQMESDDKTIIGKLHHHIVALQVSEGMAIKKLENTRSKVSKLNAHILRLEQKLDDKEEDLYHAKMEAHNKSKYLKQTIQDLRRQFSGSLPLLKQEKFAEAMRSLHESKTSLQQDLNKAKIEREAASTQLSELKLKHQSLEELLSTLKDGKGASKVVEWHKKMEAVRLEDLKLNRNITKLHEQIKYLEGLNTAAENNLLRLEEENVRNAKHYEERQLLWDQREVELERTVVKLEKQQQEFAEAAHRFEEATGSVPNPELPIANQLEEALSRIKDHVKMIVGSRQENKNLKQQITELKSAISENDGRNTQQAKMINELRLRLPVNERVAVTQHIASVVARPEDYEAKKALKVAQSTISSLQQMITKKEESILKYQGLLKEARDDLIAQTQQHKTEIKVLQDRLNLETDEAFRKFKAHQLETVNATKTTVLPGAKELKRLAELEEMVGEQENALAAASERFRRTKEEISHLTIKHEDDMKALSEKYTNHEANYLNQIKDLRSEMELREQRLREKAKENEVLTEELEAAKEANERAPTRTMKSLVERLRNQLMIKDREQKKLSKALMDLRADMVTAAEENLRAHTQQMSEEVNVQMVVERETGDLRGKIEGLQTRLTKTRTELKKQVEKEDDMKEENNRLKKELEKKKLALVQMAELKEEEKAEEMRGEKDQALKVERRKRLEAEQRVEELEKQVRQLKNAEKESKEALLENDEKQIKAMKADEQVKKWEESKKWQQKVETLKTKLIEKNKELEKCEKSLAMCREALGRNDREKLSLQNKLKGFSSGQVDVPALHKDDEIQDMKRRLFDMENENQELHQRLAHDSDIRKKELEIENEDLKERLDFYELQLEESKSEREKDESVNQQVFHDASRRNKQLQRQLLEVKKENMELQFGFEQAKKETPRLKARVKDLQEYVEILKSELEAAKKREKTRKRNMGTGMAGQSVEDMERVIAAMRRVVERLQIENDNLKKHSSSDNLQPPQLIKENKKLKQELKKVKQSGQGSAKNNEKTSEKLANEHDKLCKTLSKEIEESKRLKLKVSGLTKTVDEKQNEIDELKKKLGDAESRVPHLEGLDAKHWKSAVATRMMEQKVKSLETDLEKKNTMLQDIKTHLRTSIDKENNLLKIQADLEEKIAILERFPTDIQLDSDLVKELQDARLRLSQVETDREKLNHDLRRLREMSMAENLPKNMDSEEIMEKLADYENVLRVNVELETRVKTIELERDRLNLETKQLRKELEAFDPAFFEEIEDLKYNFQKAIERNVLYERQLREVSTQFGIDVNIPQDDDNT